jgi:hypothetical protein
VLTTAPRLPHRLEDPDADVRLTAMRVLSKLEPSKLVEHAAEMVQKLVCKTLEHSHEEDCASPMASAHHGAAHLGAAHHASPMASVYSKQFVRPAAGWSPVEASAHVGGATASRSPPVAAAVRL